jgi:hypothetical protein
LSAIKDFREDLVVGAECMFTWYWLAGYHPISSVKVPE